MQDWMIAVGFIVMLLAPCLLASVSTRGGNSVDKAV